MVSVVADHPLVLKEAPDSIVVADDGDVWVASNSLQAFVRMDPDSGNFEKHPYANGGAIVLGATAGDRGSLWYLDGLNNMVVWRIDRFGLVRSVSLGGTDRGPPSGLGSIAGSTDATTIFRNTLVKFDEAGPREMTPMPTGHMSGGPIAIAADRTTWFSTYSGSTGIGWLTASGLYDFASTPQVSGLVACSGSGAAYLSWERGPGAHADDYVIGWLSNSGSQQSVRRWPAPSPTPTPGRLRIIPDTSTCGLCGGGLTKLPPRRSLGLLACTASTAWVQIDDRLDRLQPDGKVESFDLHSLLDGSDVPPESPNAATPQPVWIYSVAMQRLIELALR